MVQVMLLKSEKSLYITYMGTYIVRVDSTNLSASIMATYSDIKDNAKHIVICRGLVVVIS